MEHAPFIMNNPQNREPAITIHHKTYSIGVNDDHEEPGVGIFDRATINWPIPIVLGPKPTPCKLGYSALSLNDDRILVVKKGWSTQEDDCFWCLEVNTEYVKEKKKILKDEVVAWSKVVIGNSDKHVVITGPSGVGKGTLVSMLMKEFPTMFGFSVSHTTRAPRNMEKDGVDYYFTEKTVMEKEIKEGKFLELACVHGNLYGTSIEAVEAVADKGKRCILEIDVQGARLVKQNSLEAVFIFICPPSMEELEKRLRARGIETEEQILKRLSNAEAEIEQGKSSGVFDHILCNDNLEVCYKNLKKVLELDGTRVNYHSVSKVDDKITISCGTENESKRLIVFDVASVRGGAPGRTRINELTND